eukprot:scaffold438016_cov52-Prasinocladus_malaysianus.AAC.2
MEDKMTWKAVQLLRVQPARRPERCAVSAGANELRDGCRAEAGRSGRPGLSAGGARRSYTERARQLSYMID